MNSRKEPVLWTAAIAVAALGTWLLYDAKPGINWGIWTTVAASGLLLFVRHERKQPLILVGLVAAVISFGAAVTADEFMNALTVLGVIFFLALEMLLSTNPSFDRLTAVFVVPAPIVAFATAISESVKRATHALHIVRSHRARATVRGILITIPVIVVFALLLSSADPVFASWRDAVEELLKTWEFLPRTIFFIGLLGIVLGAFGFADHDELPPRIDAQVDDSSSRWLGATERLILLGSVAVLFWTFLAVQLSYLFGNLPQVAGSGMTFAEYARRGFGELTVVASASVLLILVSERFGKREGHTNIIRMVTVAIIVAVLFLLGSAFNRVLLYEDAYGFTTARLYAQSYMLVVALALIALGLELRNQMSPSRFFRRTFAAGTAVFIVLLYWNHSAWIASRNIDRFATTGKLDTRYLASDLSLDAVPAIVELLPVIPEPTQTELRNAIHSRHAKRPKLLEMKWYEWNSRRVEAKQALLKLQ